MPTNGKPVNVRFEMMHAMMRHWGRNGLTYRDGIVWVALWDRAFKDNRVTRFPQDRLAKQLGMPLSSLKASLTRLEQFEWLKRKRGGPGRPTYYVLHAPPGWDKQPENSAINTAEFLGPNTAEFSGDLGAEFSGYLPAEKLGHNTVSSEEDIAARQPDCFGSEPSDAPSPFL